MNNRIQGEKSIEERIIYHGDQTVVRHPAIIRTKFHRDFGTGFYCTIFEEQAIRWATRYPMTGYVNRFSYCPDPELRVKYFPEMTEEWLDFIAGCRNGGTHGFDIVEGPMANDTIFNYVQDFTDGKISREAFWALAKFKRPTHQISFQTPRALTTLTFTGADSYEN